MEKLPALFRFYLDELRARPFEVVTAIAVIAVGALAWHAAMGGAWWWEK